MNSARWRLLLHGFVAILVLLVVAAFASRDPKDIQTINRFVAGDASRLLDYATVVAAVGTVAMALVELIKALGDLRRWFNLWKLRQWIEDQRAFDDLLFLAIGDRARADALCGQPLEKMMGQIQAAANVALDFPTEYEAFYRFLTTTDVTGSVRTSVRDLGSPDKASADREDWLQFVAARQADSGRAEFAQPRSVEPTPFEQAASRARVRLSNLVARKLDGFQLRTQYYWERSNQLASVIGSVGIMYYALVLADMGEGLTLKGLLLGVLSGALAPFAKDLTSSLAQFTKST